MSNRYCLSDSSSKRNNLSEFEKLTMVVWCLRKIDSLAKIEGSDALSSFENFLIQCIPNLSYVVNCDVWPAKFYARILKQIKECNLQSQIVLIRNENIWPVSH